MAVKQAKSGKKSTRKKAAATKKKRARSTATPPHHDYEAKIRSAVKGMAADVQTIRDNLDDNDPNTAPTEGILKRITALISETTNGTQDPTLHDNKIERVLYAIAGMDDQYNIGGKRPPTQASPPTGAKHERKVLTLFTTINSICRDVFYILEPATVLKPQPTPGGIDITDDIVAMAVDTQIVVDHIRNHIETIHALIISTSK